MPKGNHEMFGFCTTFETETLESTFMALKTRIQGRNDNSPGVEFTMGASTDCGRSPKTPNNVASTLFNTETEGFGFMLKLKRSFLDRVVFLRVGPFYSHIPDGCHKSHNLL